jgi:hypothetical protein
VADRGGSGVTTPLTLGNDAFFDRQALSHFHQKISVERITMSSKNSNDEKGAIFKNLCLKLL